MSWITLTLRKQTLRGEINDAELQLLTVSRRRNAVLREKSYHTSIFRAQKNAELAEAYVEIKELRDQGRDLDKDSDEYKDWQQEYAFAKEDYMQEKQNIENYYDELIEEVEEETTEKENEFDEEQTEIESLIESYRAELESVTQQIQSDIQSETVKFQ